GSDPLKESETSADSPADAAETVEEYPTQYLSRAFQDQLALADNPGARQTTHLTKQERLRLELVNMLKSQALKEDMRVELLEHTYSSRKALREQLTEEELTHCPPLELSKKANASATEMPATLSFKEVRDPETGDINVSWGFVWNLLRIQLWSLMSDPDSSRAAYSISVTILILIMLSSVTFCLETMDEFKTDQSETAFSYIEVYCIVVFTVEFVLKLISAPRLREFCTSYLTVIDFVAILPFYISLAASSVQGGGTQILRVVRLVRVFRILRLGGRYGKIQVVAKAVVESLDMLAMMVFLLLLSIIIFSSLIYFSEKGTWDGDLQRYIRDDELVMDEDGNPIGSPFRSIPDSFWWCMVTLMTVGYGEIYPVTTYGKLVAAAAMVASVLIMALPISVIGTHFTQQWIEYKERAKYKDSRRVTPYFLELVAKFDEHCTLLEDLLKRVFDLENEVMNTLFRLKDRLSQEKRKSPLSNKQGGMLERHMSRRANDRSSAANSTLLAKQSLRRAEIDENDSLCVDLLKQQKSLENTLKLLNVLLGKEITWSEVIDDTRNRYKTVDSLTVEVSDTILELEDLTTEYREYREAAKTHLRESSMNSTQVSPFSRSLTMSLTKKPVKSAELEKPALADIRAEDATSELPGQPLTPQEYNELLSPESTETHQQAVQLSDRKMMGGGSHTSSERYNPVLGGSTAGVTGTPGGPDSVTTLDTSKAEPLQNQAEQRPSQRDGQMHPPEQNQLNQPIEQFEYSVQSQQARAAGGSGRYSPAGESPESSALDTSRESRDSQDCSTGPSGRPPLNRDANSSNSIVLPPLPQEQGKPQDNPATSVSPELQEAAGRD
ncbi:hypothetical protein CYMTET_11217, partial [Cymbomonas tetramitiformis]